MQLEQITMIEMSWVMFNHTKFWHCIMCEKIRKLPTTKEKNWKQWPHRKQWPNRISSRTTLPCGRKNCGHARFYLCEPERESQMWVCLAAHFTTLICRIYILGVGLSEIFSFFLEYTTKNQKMPNHTNICQMAIIFFKNLVKTQPQKGHGQKMMHSANSQFWTIMCTSSLEITHKIHRCNQFVSWVHSDRAVVKRSQILFWRPF